ncbi:ribonuclease HII [Geosporobacter ferrireducens]|uniref:Ribonuclease HII n=1 Tax=Geosporobacter ferrireducens TaxID=1424294 RepID=A0A1D8GBX8_9FIRM|nr:ribonuclease HII [Geosporobacter ferrireducens]AOT68380.1 ribonuclease HII [Geosporobacter ferrireducens]
MDFKAMTGKEIEAFLKDQVSEHYKLYIPKLMEDERSAVQKIGLKLQKKLEKLSTEKERVESLWFYEKELAKEGYRMIAGLDEAGRGPLAGPVVAAAVILPFDLFIDGINDSKKISEKKREKLYDIINEKALAVGVGIVENNVIDEINILRATKRAMGEAVKNLEIKSDFLLIDAVKLTDIKIKQQSVIKGDQKSISIAAASIIAKVTRDRIMNQYHEVFPEYGFVSHKGYGTKEHYESIEKHGITPIHRKSFLQNL